jgi:hypothetical protein
LPLSRCNLSRTATEIALPATFVAVLSLIGGCGRPSCPIDAASDVPEDVAQMNPQRSEAPAQTTVAEGVQSQVDGTAVSATLRLARARARIGDQIELSVSLRVAPLWEIGTLDANPEASATRLDLELPNWLASQGAWDSPAAGQSHRPGGDQVYADEAVFSRTLVVNQGAAAGEHPVRCRITYQACDDRQCVRPAPIVLEVSLCIE